MEIGEFWCGPRVVPVLREEILQKNTQNITLDTLAQTPSPRVFFFFFFLKKMVAPQ